MINLEKHIKYMWEDYKKSHNGNSPRYADCQVRWLDNDESMPVWIKLNHSRDKYDDYIFYYCNGLNDLLSLSKEGVEDFVLVDVFDFYGNIARRIV